MEVLAILCRYEAQYLTLDILNTRSLVFCANVAGYCIYVVHQHLNIGEDCIVNVLEHIVGSITLGHYTVGSIDKSVTKRLYLAYCTLNVELCYNLLKIVQWSKIL